LASLIAPVRPGRIREIPRSGKS